MGVLHRALLTWFLVAVFHIFLTLKLDEKTDWNWFIVFVPMWLFDCKIVMFIAFRIFNHCKNGIDRPYVTMYRKMWYLLAVVLKVAFQILLCVRLQYEVLINWFFVMIPLWILLVGIGTEVFTNLVSRTNL